jgi:hypothetical protein
MNKSSQKGGQRASLASRFLLLGVIGFNLGNVGCLWKKTPQGPPATVSLFSGVAEMAVLNDSEVDVRKKLEPTGAEITVIQPADSPALQELKMERLLYVKSQGLRLYFRQGRIALIEIQEPFRGKLVGRDLELFPFHVPSRPGQTERSWEDILVREFGPPRNEVGGGRLSSQGLFYNWGDISFNGLGPNQIAIYRDADIVRYREKNFGRVLSIFTGP